MHTGLSCSNPLADIVQHATAIRLTGLQPRRTLNLADKKSDWKAALATLRRFAASPGYQAPLQLQAHAALENYWQWQAAGQEACHLLVYGIDLGLPAATLRPLYLGTAALWRDAASVAEHARQSMAQATAAPYGVPAPIATRTSDYRYAVLLTSLAVLLDAPEAIAALVEHTLGLDTDRLLDYLSAAALELEQASDDLFHRRPYGALAAFFDQLGDALPDPLVGYVQSQYSDFHRLSPKQQKKGGPWLGTWYWALEVAALSALYGWDDAALRASPHYPADLVDFVRERQAQSGL
ncbi:MAG: DUF1911 domain-containing protein [Acidovorax sp.]|jgi:hypothetical protein|nr:DUF1911 domain-containing protein [Acidovorax sp.]